MVKLIEGKQKYYFPSTFPWPPLNHVYNNQWVKFMKKLWWCKSLFDILLGCEVNTNWVRLRKLRLPNEKPAEDLRGGWYLTSSKLFTKGMCPGDVAVHAHKTVASAVSSPGAGKVLWPLSCPSSSIYSAFPPEPHTRGCGHVSSVPQECGLPWSGHTGCDHNAHSLSSLGSFSFLLN